MTQINDIRDLVRVLEENPEWLHTIRGLLVSDDLQNLPARLAELTDSFNALDKRMDVAVSDLTNKMDTLDNKIDTAVSDLNNKIDSVATDLNNRIDGVATDLKRLEGKVDNHYGAAYEAKVARHIRSIAGQHLGLISVRVHHGGDSGIDPVLDETLTEAAEQGDAAFNQVNNLLSCDLIISGRRRGEQQREYAVFEASVTVGNDDVNRASERAAILAAFTGSPARGVVIGATLGSTQADLAQSRGASAIAYAE